MTTMNDYTIFCTEEQIKKADKLCAPLEKKCFYKNDFERIKNEGKDHYSKIEDNVEWDIEWSIGVPTPTAEQMCGWLEKLGILVLIDPSQDKFYGSYSLRRDDGYWSNRIFLDGLYPSREEATLAAIDAALDYLTKNKK